jgi:hypothetical protein
MTTRTIDRLRASWARMRDPRALLAHAADAALIGAGLATAAGSIGFAAFMLAQDDHPPEVYGQKYFAIYAQPRRTATGAARPNSPPPVPVEIDMSPVGSIEKAAPTGGGSIPIVAAGFTLVAAKPGIAWLREGSRIVAVRPGELAAGLGRIAAIVQRDGRWYLLGDTGAALLSSDGPAVEGAPSAPAPFSRRMIFGDDK